MQTGRRLGIEKMKQFISQNTLALYAVPVEKTYLRHCEQGSQPHCAFSTFRVENFIQRFAATRQALQPGRIPSTRCLGIRENIEVPCQHWVTHGRARAL
jgi:hypothetical protein